MDEPEVYLHPDLQRRVVQLVDSINVQQFIVASHSVDILNEFEPDDVLYIEKSTVRGRRLDSLTDVQRVTTALGSSLNSYFAKLARSHVGLFVEGSDFQVLRRLAEKSSVPDFALQKGFAVIPIEGADNWERLLPMNWVMENFTGEKIRAFLILDRDYRCDAELAHISGQLAQKGVRCHFWRRKELENYLLVPRAIAAASRPVAGKKTVGPDDLADLMKRCADSLRSQVLGERISNESRFRKTEGVSQGTIAKNVLTAVESCWDKDWMSLVGGKDLLSSERSELEKRGVHAPTDLAIARQLRPEEVDVEVSDFCRLVATAARPKKSKCGY